MPKFTVTVADRARRPLGVGGHVGELASAAAGGHAERAVRIQRGGRAGAARRRAGREHVAARVGVVRQHAWSRSTEDPGHVAGVGVVAAVGAPPFAPTFKRDDRGSGRAAVAAVGEGVRSGEGRVRRVGEGPARVEGQRATGWPGCHRHARDGHVIHGHVAAEGGVERDVEGVGIGLRDDRGGKRTRRSRDTRGAARAGRRRIAEGRRGSRAGSCVGSVDAPAAFTSRKPCMPPSG